MSHSDATRDDPSINPNSLHQFHSTIRGPKGIPNVVLSIYNNDSVPKDPGHTHARTEFVDFKFYNQRSSNAPFGYEHFVSLPRSYHKETSRRWPLILFLHGSGESQRAANQSYSSLRHGIPKIVLCYDKLKTGDHDTYSSIEIPVPPSKRKNKQAKPADKSSEPVPALASTLLAENFMTVTPSLNMSNGYGWSSSILSALLDEILQRFRIDANQVHLTGFSMGGYGVWDLSMRESNRFATLTPICGGGDPAQARKLHDLPIWIHHGAKDDIIPAKASQIMFDALLNAGSNTVKFTCDPDLKHDCWTEAYNNMELYQWMLDNPRQDNTVSGEEVPWD